jgi:S-layer protein
MPLFATGAALTAALNALPSSLKGTYKAFDDFYYAGQYMTNYTGSLSPVEHFVTIGAARGYSPNENFDPAFYRAQFSDLATFDSADLLIHYVKFGLNEGRAGNATLASSDWAAYLTAYPAVAAYVNANLSSFGGSATNGAIAHYVKFGAQQGFTLPNTVGQTFTLTASSPSVTETDSATKVLTFTLTLDKAPATALVINYAVNSTSTAVLGDDFAVTAGNVTFAAGQTTAEIQVNVLADDADEANETIVLSFTNKDMVNSKLAVASVKRVNDLNATGTIIDDDASFVFTSSAANTVAENTTAVVTVAGADADSATGLTTTLSGADAALFSLTNGALAFKAAPNFEAPADAGANNVYNVSINVADASGNATTQNLVITVSDANEAPTALALTGQVASIAENTVLTASRKVADIVVTDDALGTEAFTLSGADAASFEIVGTELHLKAGTALNFEAKTAYNVTVSAADAALTGSTPVTAAYALAVTNVNEAPVAVADGPFTVITGNSITMNVLANDTDVDAGTTLAISGTPTASVGTVAVSGGQLVYTAPAGFQGAATISYSITDGAIVVPTTQLVSVGEPALSAAAASVNEGSPVVFNIKGVANTAYSVNLDFTNLNGAADRVDVVTTDASGNAQVTIATTVDRTTEGAQSVRANIVGTLAAPVSVSVADTSLNNVAPVATSATLAIAEGAAAVTGQLVATDADAADVANLTFSTASVVPGFTLNANGSYSFNATNAAYNTLAVGQTSVQTVAFTVNDNATTAGGGARTATGTLTITVTGTNDVPVVTVANATPTVTENTTLVTTFATSDVDAGDTLGRVTLGGDDAALFQIVDATGRLEFRTAPDFEAPTDANRDGIYNVTLNVTDNNGGTGSRAVAITVADGPEVGRVYVLTGGGDAGVAFTADSGNDTFNALDTNNNAGGVIPTWTVGDAINGGLGNDVFNITQTTGIVNPLGATVTGIETLNAITNNTVANTNLNTTTFTGLTALNVTAPGTLNVTAAGTTATTVTNGTLANTQTVTIDGGSTVNATTTAAVTVGAGAGTVTVGATTAATGAVTVNTTSTLTVAAGDNDGTGSVVNVTGGTSVTVNNTLATVGTATDTDTLTGAVVTVNGSASTTAVSVTQTAARAVSLTAGAEVVGIVNGNVGITDAGVAGATADTISSVTLANFGVATITSSALTTLNVTGGAAAGVASGAITLTAQGTVTPATTLTVNSAGGFMGAITGTQAAAYTTININSTAATTIADLTTTAATQLNFTGAAATTMTANTLGAALVDINVTGTGGVTLAGAALAVGTDFDGNNGADTITISGASTQGITMGDGDDTVTIAAGTIAGTGMGVGGSLSGGNGANDTIVMTAADAVAAALTNAFNADVSGFEVLSIGATAGIIDLDNIQGIDRVVLTGANTGRLDDMDTGGTVTLGAAANNVTVNLRDANTGTADTLNITISNATNAALTAGTVTAANVETVNISTVDAGVGADVAATIDTATLVAIGATTVTVSGNNGLNLTNTGNVAITTFNASGVVGNGATDTAANLAVTFVSANTTAAATVTITGGAGNDALTGNAAIDSISGADGDDVIDGAAGNDILNGGTGNDSLTGGAGADVMTGGTGRDAFVQASTIGATTSSPTATPDQIADFGITTAAIAAGTAIANVAAFQAGVFGGLAADILSINLTAAGPADQAITVEANTVAGGVAGQAAGVTATVTSGILTLSGVGATAVDTLGEWLVEAAAIAATAGDILAFQFGTNTFVYAENGALDVLVQLTGVSGATGLVEISGATTAAVGSIMYADIA